MNGNLQNILQLIGQSEPLTGEQKDAIVKSIKDADKELTVTAFKLERTEKVKHTTSILLEETIEELEQKRKAVEVQNRELEIESALERVRAQAMSMRTPYDLPGICEILYKELLALGITEIRNAMVNIYDDEKRTFINYDYSDEIGQSINHLAYDIHPVIEKQVEQIRRSADAFSETYYAGRDLEDWKAFRKSVGEKDDPRIEESTALFYYFFSIGTGAIGISTFNATSQNHLNVLKRCRNVFELCYRRYIDIEVAEAQAREAQIQLALERVRARTMAMQRSDELPIAANLLFQQVQSLGLPAWSAGYCIWDEDKQGITLWMSSEGVMQKPFHAPLTKDPSFIHMKEAYERNENFHLEEVGGEALVTHYQYMRTLPVVGEILDSIIAEGHPLPSFQIFHCAYFVQGFLLFITYEPVTAAHDIFKRFSKVFEQTYTRFLDLQKAEAQARESQIQLALERVRARTMAMQRSEELAEASFILDNQVRALGIKTRGCAFNIYGNNESTEWFSSESGTMPTYKTPRENIFLRYYEEGQKGKDLYIESFEGDACAAHYDYLCTLPGTGESLKKFKESGGSFPTRQTDHVAYFKYGYLLFITLESVPAAHDIFKRFAKVFEQTYTRFLDLQKAETQARESQIQLALERVRARTMAMQKSDELKYAATLLFQQVKTLGVPAYSCGYNIWEKGEKEFTSWMSTQDGSDIDGVSNIPLTEDANFIRYVESKKKGEPFFVLELRGERMQEHYEYLKTIPAFKGYFDYAVSVGFDLPQTQIHHVGNFSQGNLLFITLEPCPEFHNVFKRFAAVFEQTYTRFLDLQKAEEQALEAIKRASVDRVRAEIASMRTTADLERITPLIWNELTTLAVPFIRCGVFIMDEDKREVQTFLYTEGKTIASFTSTYSNSSLIVDVLPYWRRKEIYKTHWDEAAFLEQAKTLVQQGAITSGEKYLTEHRPTDLYLHFLPFLQGMLYVGDAAELSEENLQLVQALTDAFSTAYARYEDFNKLEAAKKQVDKTLNELKETQKQLIQSEKMASLGELTAGIAHEIQNPLNFVNNFSDVNAELLEELEEELTAGNTEEAIALANDIKENELKINHHGKRADAIVKGMLQHSRSSPGQKEPADINKIADEYLRLSYHGLRAKDKMFNSVINTDFDAHLEKIDIVAQDIGRVLLNLFNNAFYAVNEKKKKSENSFDPIISVSTKKENNLVFITVSDNGNGIQQKVLDKIFQPFFTTKPTGQGTGLGLSLSYDIIKAHGGEIKVKTQEGEGTVFIIELPVM